MSARLMTRALILLSALLLFIQTITAPVSASPLAQAAVEPQSSARAAIVVEYPSGRIMYQKDAHQQLAPVLPVLKCWERDGREAREIAAATSPSANCTSVVA